MEPTMHSRCEKHKWWVSNVSRIAFIVILVIVCFKADIGVIHDMFEPQAITSAAVIASFPTYIVLSYLPNLLDGLIDFSCHQKILMGLFFMYVLGLKVAFYYLPEGVDIWQLFVPFILASGIEVLWVYAKGYAPIEMNRGFRGTPSIGEVWANACSSYYFEVFKDFVERLKKFEKQQRLVDDAFSIRLQKMIILVPLSCDVQGTLDKHPNCYYVDILEIHKDAQGGNVNRQYKNPIYKITSTDGESHMHIAIEQPNTLIAVKKLHGSVPEEIWKFQRNEFISTLQDRLSDQKCCAILLYDDLQEGSTQPLNEFLLEEVRKLCT